MTVSNSWLVNVSVGINTTVVQSPDFNDGMLVGVMPTQSSPYQCPPTSWGTDLFKVYSSAADFSAEFTPLIAAAVAQEDILQANRFSWLVNAVSAYFSQNPSPLTLTVAAMPPPDASTNYTTILENISIATNDWYGFSICDNIPAQEYATLQIAIAVTLSGPSVMPSGTILTAGSSIPVYFLPQAYTFPSSGTYVLTFYSLDGATRVPASTITGVSPTQSFVTSVTNAASTSDSIPGLMTPTTGVSAALANLRGATLNSPKKLFIDTNHTLVAQAVQSAGGSKDMMICYHSMNLQSYNVSSSLLTASLSSASLSAYFTSLFNAGVGMKPLSSMQIIGQPVDLTINTANIGQPGVVGSSSCLIGWNNNVYAGFGSSSPGIGLIQYGFMSSTITGTNSQLVYLDQVVGADFIQLTAQADLVTFIISQQPTGGILYNDAGIQQIVSVFKGSIQKSVAQNIIQSPLNSAFVYTNYANVSIGDITNRIYKDLYFNGNFLSRIQQIAVNINLSL